MIKRLRIKFICVNMLIVFIMLCAIFLTVLTFMRSRITRDSADFMKDVAADKVDGDAPFAPRDGMRLPFFSVDVGEGGAYKVVEDGSDGGKDEAWVKDVMERSMSDPKPSGFLPEYNLRYYKTDTATSQRVIFTDASNEVHMMNNLYRLLAFVGGISLLVFFLISLALSWWAIRPVEQAWQQQKRFISDASHELKTPLTLIALNAELMAEDEACSREPLSGRLSKIEKGAASMRSLVESLLDMARADSGIPKKQFSPVKLSKLAELTADSFEALFMEKKQSLTVDITQDITVMGSAEHLEQLVSILLDNANKYGDEGGAASIRLETVPRGRCRLCVSNTGAEIPREDLKKIFRRFYRRDEARTVNGSYGLGLAIAWAIAEEHGGKIWAESGGGENRFLVTLPTVKQREK